MSAQCAYCGATLKPHSMFCGACGQLSGVAQDRKPTQAFPPPFGEGTSPVTPVTARPTTAAQPPASFAPVPLPPEVNAGGATEAPRPAAAPAQLMAMMLHLPSGHAVPLGGRLVIGRLPEASAAPATAAGVLTSLLTVPDKTRSVSRSHLLIESSATGVTVTDLGSANGSAVERAGEKYVVQAGSPFKVRAGDKLWLGSLPLELR